MKQKINFVDLFSGAGGLLRGFMDAGYTPLLSIENWKPSIETHKKNYPDVPIIDKDIREVSKKDVLEVISENRCDVVVGGPPCQGFSTIGKRMRDDPRNSLILEFVRIVDILKPKFFLMENVRGMLSPRNKSLVEEVLESFKKIGYSRVVKKVLCAADFGVPQMRYRVFFLGVKDGVKVGDLYLPEPLLLKEDYKTVGDAINDIADLINVLDNHIPMNHNETVVKRIMATPEGEGLPNSLNGELAYGSRSDYKKNKLKNFSHVYKRLHRNKPSTTIVPGHNAFPLHPIAHRALTVREAARIQTFSDDIVFCGTRQEQCIQVGNAVPVKLAEELAKHIKRYFNKSEVN